VVYDQEHYRSGVGPVAAEAGLPQSAELCVQLLTACYLLAAGDKAAAAAAAADGPAAPTALPRGEEV
jgi:hypothetical protein